MRNFWSHESRLPPETLERLLVVLKSLYSSRIEEHFLSLATDLLLEMTSRSPDYTLNIFEFPLSECKFQVRTVVKTTLKRSYLHAVYFSWVFKSCLVFDSFQSKLFFKTIISMLSVLFVYSRTMPLTLTGVCGVRSSHRCLWRPKPPRVLALRV